MTENGIMLEEDTNQDEIEENQTEEKLLEEDPEMFRKSRKEKQRDSIHEEHKECMIKKRRVNTSVSDPLSEGVEQIEKSSLEEKMQSHGGPGHHHGGGAPHEQINTRACGISSLQEEIEVHVPADDLTLPTDLDNSNQREQEELLQPVSEEVESSSHEEDTVNPNGGPAPATWWGGAPKTNKYPGMWHPQLANKTIQPTKTAKEEEERSANIQHGLPHFMVETDGQRGGEGCLGSKN